MTTINGAKCVVILAAAPGRLQEVERFLGHRGWVVRLHSDLKSFLADVADLKPRLALMSVDFSHPNLARIRPLLTQIYRTTVIDFTEESGPASWAKLQELPSGEKIFGPLSGPAFERAASRLSVTESFHASTEEIQTALRTAAPELMEKVFGPSAPIATRRLGWVSRVTCLQVRTPLISGHFVVAMASDTTLEADLTTVWREAVFELFRALNIEIKSADAFPIDIRKVEFRNWALSTSLFLESSVHQGFEVAMAFFPATEDFFSLPAMEGNAKMAPIPLDDIRPEAKIDFELYLHLPLNGKFVLYISRGGWMSFQQQLNLQARGVNHMHVRTADTGPVLRERTRRNFDRSIADFYERRTAAA